MGPNNEALQQLLRGFVVPIFFLILGARVIFPVALYLAIISDTIWSSSAVSILRSTTKPTFLGSLMYPMQFGFKIRFN
jgi:hypothetical protein